VFVFIIAAGLASGAARETGAAAETLRRRRAGGDRRADGAHGAAPGHQAPDHQTDATQRGGGEPRLQADRPDHATDDTMADPASSGGARSDR
jgi:hypothetical protein